MFSTSVGGYILIAAIFLLNVSFVRLDCPRVLLSQCNGANSVQNYLDNPFPSNVNLDVRCNSPPVLVGWSLSPNGTEPDAKLIDTSLPKYTQNGNTLRIHGVNASDGGLYCCVYATGGVPRLCILVHARAAFASCPSSSGGCSDPENITVTVGESINFNASVVFIGGSCGFKQDIERTVLKRCLNNSCTTPLIVPQNPESDIFTLPNSSLEDSGLYQVIVMGTHPNGSGSTSIEKLYWVTVNAPTTATTTTATTEEQETTTSTVEEGTTTDTIMTGISSGIVPTTLVTEEVTTEATSTSLSKASQSTTATTTIFDDENPQSDGSPIMVIVSIVLVVVVIGPVAVIIIVICTQRKCTRRKGSATICVPRTDKHLENGLGEGGNPFGHSSKGTDHSSEGGSSTASLIGENANDVHSSNEQEGNERREPESDACEIRESIGVIMNPMTTCASSREPPERSDVSSQTSSTRHVQLHPIDNNVHVQQSLGGSQQGSGYLTDSSEGSSSIASLISGDATDARGSNEQEENENEPNTCVDGGVLPHSSSFNDNQEDLEVLTNPTSREIHISTRSDASSPSSIEEDSPVRPSTCPGGNSGHIPQSQASSSSSTEEDSPLRPSTCPGGNNGHISQSRENPLSREQRIKLKEGLKPLDLRPEISELMNKVAARTPAKWMVLGIQLGIEASQLQALEDQYRGNGEKIYIDIFNRWKKKADGKPKTWSTVIDALKTPSVDEVALARDLELSITPSSCASTNSLASSRSWEQTHSMA